MDLKNIKREVEEDYRLVKRILKKLTQFIYQAILKYLRDDVTVKAAGLAFYQLLTLIPIMMLLFYVLGRVLGNEKVFFKVLQSSTIFKPDIQVVVMKNIKRIIDTGIFTALFGFFLFLFLTRKYLRELFFAVKRIIGENPKRPTSIRANVFRYLRNVAVQLLYILAYVLLIGFSAFASSIALNYFGVLEEILGELNSVVKFMVTSLLLLLPLTAYTCFYYFIYWGAPDFRPQKKYALMGAIFTTITNQVLMFVYKLYVERFLIGSNIYGTLSTVAALVIWYYFSSIVVLFGAIIVYMLNKDSVNEYHI